MKRLVRSLAIGIGLVLVAGSTLNVIVGVGYHGFAVGAILPPATEPATLDSDLDGLSDADEAIYGTNLLLADSDGDGMSDGSEIAWGVNPLDPNSHHDLEANLVREFDGFQNQVQVADSDALTPPDVLTVSAWVQLAGNEDGVILTKGSYTMAIAGRRLVFEVWFHGQARSLVAAKVIPDSGWHHVAGVCDGKALRIYLDGSPVGVAHKGGVMDATDDPLAIGQLAGTVADVRIYNKAMSDGEIALLRELGMSGGAQ